MKNIISRRTADWLADELNRNASDSDVLEGLLKAIDIIGLTAHRMPDGSWSLLHGLSCDIRDEEWERKVSEIRRHSDDS